MTLMLETIIPPMSGRAFELKAGDIISITDIEGGQPGDFVVFDRHDFTVRFNQARTRVENAKYTVGAGDKLWSGSNPPFVMLEIMPESQGIHSLMYSPCCRYALKKRFNVSCDGCFEHLQAVLSEYGVGASLIPDPLSLFFNAVTGMDGVLGIGQHQSRSGDTIFLRALVDSLVAVTTCSVPIAGRKNSPYKVRLLINKPTSVGAVHGNGSTIKSGSDECE